MIFLLDNYDSFVYNLYQYLMEMGRRVEVLRNDEIAVGDVFAMRPQAVVVSPGPGRPAEAGICKALIAECANRKTPLLGVCLGHQALGEVFGGRVQRAKKLMHGKTSQIRHDGKTLFAGLPSPQTVMRYHSLALAAGAPPPGFVISARNMHDNEIMAMRHKRLPLEGVQFHPESIMTREGKTMLKNFVNHHLPPQKGAGQ